VSVEAFLRWLAYDILWNPYLPFLFLVAGVIVSAFHGFFQFRKFGTIVKNVFGARAKVGGPGIITQLEAFFTTVGNVVGLGNIVGVASAIALAGPGAVFWMWMSALVGMGLKAVEAALAVHTRTQLPDGRTYGGPTWYMELLHKIYRIPKWVVSILIGTFIIGFYVTVPLPPYSYTIQELFKTTFKLPVEWAIAIGFLHALFATIVVAFEIPGVAKFSYYAVPTMLVLYFFFALSVLVFYAPNIPQAISDIFTYAFQPVPAIAGGFAGATMLLTMRVGIARGIYSNEAGWGTSPHIYATSKGVRHPGDVSPLAAMDVFTDTIVICTLTGLMVTASGVWKTGIGGFTAVAQAVRSVYGEVGVYILFAGTWLFMITTYVGGAVYQMVLWRYMLLPRGVPVKTVDKVVRIWNLIRYWPAMIVASYFMWLGLRPAIVWITADIANAIPLYPHLITLILLAPLGRKLIKEWEHIQKSS